MNELLQVQATELAFQNTSLSCPLQEGHRMIAVKTVCAILGVDYQTQDSWLKEHPFFSQLYRLAYIVAADNKEREMNCLSFFDTMSWVSSISMNNRNQESIEKQTLFLTWLREQTLSFYKSVDAFIQENKYEAQLVQLKEATENQLLEAQNQVKSFRNKIKEIDDTIEDIRTNRFSGQTNIPFLEN